MKTIPANSNIISSLSILDEDALSVAGYAGKNSALGALTIDRKGGSNCIIATLGNLPTEVNGLVYNNMAVYPNPSTDFITISGVQGISQVQIWDITGRCRIKKPTDLKNQLDIRSLNSGIYYIKIPTLDNNRVLKFIKQ